MFKLIQLSNNIKLFRSGTPFETGAVTITPETAEATTFV